MFTSTSLRLKQVALLATFLFFITGSLKSQHQKFNNYLLRAVDTIEKNWALRGYDINGVFTHDLSFGRNKLKAAHEPGTMCVAAQLELIVTALNIYVAETGDSSVYNYLPVKHWVSTQSKTFKDLVWVNSGSSGSAYALNTYGMGKVCDYKELTPGSFVNLNRNNRTGHAVLFISYIDSTGKELRGWSGKAKGFKYYSSQGKGPGRGGFSYRYAFFGNNCPTISNDKKRDCGVIYSEKQTLLNCGFMLHPKYWNSKQRDIAIAQMKKIHSLGENGVNPAYLEQNTIDDDN
ncbi:hypothetical protein J2T02_002024 [Chitinophaga terrae (ex Kim and Jung 2007)]|uniref:hypothetical protein n=1 Tax=Chitinophaga terrae (ex Kim and Jung 2007) TaxID=408074 RepID=UPI002786A607|nr:hypothetical protein [Chitinophaga terrae (ex Kim and Jung 2007)]MDQ0106911.1 hypothetical protein [Chitinophaga terrae (ex Kim and Jung 2007)]